MLAERVTVDARAHAEQLTPNVLAALADAGLTVGDLGAVVVGCGPGPFTGLRVGMATAAAYGHALGIPVHGVCSLDAIGIGTAGDALVVTDARRREVYWARYRDGVRVAGPAVNAPADVPALPRLWPRAALSTRPRCGSRCEPVGGLSGRACAVDAAVSAASGRQAASRGDPMTAVLGPLIPHGRRAVRGVGGRSCSTVTTRGPRGHSSPSSRPSTTTTSPPAPTTSSSVTRGIARLGRKKPYEYEIHTIGVDAAYQGQGIGRQLLTALLEYRQWRNDFPRGQNRQRSRNLVV